MIKTNLLVVLMMLSAQWVAAECKLDAPNTVDSAKTIMRGETCSFTLFQNESAFFLLNEPISDVKILLDAERPRGEQPSNLQASVELLNADGSAMKADKLWMNAVGLHSRTSTAFSFQKPRRAGFKVTNEIYRAKLRLTIMRKSDTAFVPLFERITPQLIELSQVWEDNMAPNEDAYRTITLPRGAYKVLLDAATVKGENTNLQASVQLLLADGSGTDSVLDLNGVGTSERASGGFSTKEKSTWVLHVVSQNSEHSYNVRAASFRMRNEQRSASVRPSSSLAELRRRGASPTS